MSSPDFNVPEYNLKNDSLEENNLINTGLEIESNLWEEFLNNQKKAIY